MSEPIATLEPAIPAQRISLNGVWLAGDGLPVRFNQVGSRLTFKGANQFGMIVVDGSGTVRGRQAQLFFRYFDGMVYDEATATMQISPDGHRMEGLVYYTNSGISRMMGLAKQY